MARHTISEGTHPGEPPVPLLTLSSPEGLAATFVPSLGMLGFSLSDDSAELLGLGGGLAAYAERHSTLGIPLLHPWANRLAGHHYDVTLPGGGGTVSVDLDAGCPLLHHDPNGLPIHGLVAASPYWEIEHTNAGEGHALIAAHLDFAAHAEYLKAFPFPHELRTTVALAGRTLSILTTLTATGDVAVPVAFGFHPYFRLPDVPRQDWEISLPVGKHALLDDHSLPTGEVENVSYEDGPLGARVFDDLYVDVESRATFSLAGGGRRLDVRFDEGYHVAVVYAPSSDDVICFEPMTAPTNPFDGPWEPVFVEPGDAYTTAWSVEAASAPG